MQGHCPTVALQQPAGDFRCLACSQVFPSLDLLKEHYKEPVHRANLQRKISGLGPISPAEFERRNAAAAEAEETGAPAPADASRSERAGGNGGGGGGKDKHSKKRAKEAKLKARNEDRLRRHEAKMLKMQQRAEAAVSRRPPALSGSPSQRPCSQPTSLFSVCFPGADGRRADDGGGDAGGHAGGAPGGRAQAG